MIPGDARRPFSSFVDERMYFFPSLSDPVK
jgi:hypothetical protein